MERNLHDMQIREFAPGDLDSLLAVFNAFVRNSHAAYPESELGREPFEKLLAQARIILTLQAGGAVVGFGYISAYRPLPNFDHTGVLTYFILPEHTGQGHGSRLLQELFRRGRDMGITNYLAHISSRNEPSLSFHRKHGFEEVGRFRDVARKFGETFDVVWVQKRLPAEAER